MIAFIDKLVPQIYLNIIRLIIPDNINTKFSIFQFLETYSIQIILCLPNCGAIMEFAVILTMLKRVKKPDIDLFEALPQTGSCY